MILDCGNCHKKFRTSPKGNKKFCSLKCYTARVVVVCDGCGMRCEKKRCEIARAKHHFCGNKCFRKWWAAWRRATTRQGRIVVICEQCGKKCDQPRCQVSQTKHHFCGKTCADAYLRRSRKEVKCESCGRTIRKPLSDLAACKHHFCNPACSYAYKRIAYKKPRWFKDAKTQLSQLKLAQSRAQKLTTNLNGWGEGRMKWKGQWRAFEDKHLGDSFRPPQIKAHAWHLSLKDPRAAIIVRWFALGRTHPFVFENIYEFEKALERVVETKKLPARRTK